MPPIKGLPRGPYDYSQWTMDKRFWRWINKAGANGCWLWMRSLSKARYGVLTINGKLNLAHRIAWELANGPIPNQAHVLHHCDIRHCVNPDHLFLGDQRSNIADAKMKGRMQRGEDRFNAKLQNADIPIIRSRLATGVPAARIARDYGVHVNTIKDVKHRRTWTHID